MLSDSQLLKRYASDRSECDFEELIRRHADLVYATALRQLNGDVHLARDAAQIVFTDLARKAASIVDHQSLAAWLYTSTRFASAKIARTEQRRHIREEAASAMNENHDPLPALDPAQLRPLIEEAMLELDEADREAVLLRFFESRDFKSLGACLGLSHEAARKRVVRAIERLRAVLQRRGISSTEGALEAALGGAVSLAVPVDLHACILKSALSPSLQSAPAAVPRFAQLANMKTPVLLSGLAVGLATVAFIQQHSIARLRSENTALANKISALNAVGGLDGAGLNQGLSPDDLAQFQKDRSELMRLRAEVTRLRAAQRELASKAEAASAAATQPPPPQQVTIEAKFIEGPTADLKKVAWESIGLDVTGVGTTSILTYSQFKTLLDKITTTTGLDILSSPRVTTLSSRQASIQVVSESPDLGVPLGPSADLTPTVSADGYGISLVAIASLAEQVPDKKSPDPDAKTVVQTRISGNSVLWDGQTMVLSQLIGASDTAGAARENNPNSLLVFLTPTLIDRAGNPIHPQQEVQ